jgi:gamma-D-glutamyl-L-lysine dipeptidyl-peptidase
MILDYCFCNLSLVPVRAEASDRAEITTYLLFGDLFTVRQRSGSWRFITCDADGYEGWIDHKQLLLITEEEYNAAKHHRQCLGPAPYHLLEKQATGEKLYVVAGSSVPELSGSSFSVGGENYRFPQEPVFTRGADFQGNVAGFAKFFLQSPYLWGGKSLFGIDCSGFTQIVFKMLGISLLRDARLQAEQGTTVHFLQETQAGDLAFFDNDEGRITHVGIMLNTSEIIHASGRVKIDDIDGQGIYSRDLKKHTHKLRIVKRIRSTDQLPGS